MSTNTEFKHTFAEDGLKTYVTKDYDQFIMLEDNRMINWNHVLRLSEAIKAYPEGMKFEPILINDHWEIIDGQHRLKALKELGYPVYYQIGHGLDINDTIRMNVYRRNWTPLDYAYTYAARGKKDYQRYLNLHDKHLDLQHRTLMAYMQGGEGNRAGHLFNEGNFLAPDTDPEIARRLQMYYEIKDFAPQKSGFSSNRAFQRAVLTIIQHKSYDHERMVGKLEYAATKYLNAPFATLEDAARALEALYNENARDRVRFF